MTKVIISTVNSYCKHPATFVRWNVGLVHIFSNKIGFRVILSVGVKSPALDTSGPRLGLLSLPDQLVSCLCTVHLSQEALVWRAEEGPLHPGLVGTFSCSQGRGARHGNVAWSQQDRQVIVFYVKKS